MNQSTNVVGPGINIAQRVMDCGDEDHVLMTKDVAEVLIEVGGFDGSFEDLGVIKVKHDKELHLYSLRGADFGNSSTPSKFAVKRGNVPEGEPGVPPQADIPQVLAGGTPAKDPTKLTRVLLTSSDGKAIILGAERIVQTEQLTLTLIPEDDGDRAFLRGLRGQSSELLGIAYENLGMHARMRSISSLLEGSVESWTVEVQPFEGDYRGGALGEMAS